MPIRLRSSPIGRACWRCPPAKKSAPHADPSNLHRACRDKLTSARQADMEGNGTACPVKIAIAPAIGPKARAIASRPPGHFTQSEESFFPPNVAGWPSTAGPGTAPRNPPANTRDGSGSWPPQTGWPPGRTEAGRPILSSKHLPLRELRRKHQSISSVSVLSIPLRNCSFSVSPGASPPEWGE